MVSKTLERRTLRGPIWEPNIHVPDRYINDLHSEAAGKHFPRTSGLRWVLPFEKLNMEVGFDWLEPTDHPLFLTAKLGIPENALFAESPGLNVSVSGVGTETSGAGRTDQNIVDPAMGKTIPNVGRLHVGHYLGNKPRIELGDSGRDHQGFMVACDRWLVTDRLMLAPDYASGKNAIGGGPCPLAVPGDQKLSNTLRALQPVLHTDGMPAELLSIPLRHDHWHGRCR